MRRLLLRGLLYYWRSHLAVVLGIATAVAVLAGALLVGDSVRGSLRDLVLERLGRADRVVLSTAFFRESLADDLQADPAFSASFEGVCPLVTLPGIVSDQASGRRAARVQVYGIDDRFWRFHDVADATGPSARDLWVSPALAEEIGARVGSTLLVRLERPSAVPLESLHGRKEGDTRTLRLDLRRIVGPRELGEFSLQPQQGAVRAAYVRLQRLQEDLNLAGRVNVLIVADRKTRTGEAAADLDALVRRRATLADLGLTLRTVGGAVALEGAGGLLDPARARAVDALAARTGSRAQPVFAYLVNSLRSGDRQVPYSLVAAIDLDAIAPGERLEADSGRPPPLVLNEWAARDLGVKPGDPITLEFYVWADPGVLVTRSADFRIAAVVPIRGAAADRDLAPVYPGISESLRLSDWDPPFPIDLHRVRPVDEEYWKQYRTTPKAFIAFDAGRALWRSRYGDRTSVRLTPPSGESPDEARARFAAQLRASIDPLAFGLSTHDVRSDGLEASRGATDFGEYFAYFSGFLVASALLLAALFFKLGIEQRAREVGLLRSVGFTTRQVRLVFAGEGLALALIGSALGVAGAVVYGSLMMTGLRTWWSGAVGTTALTLHVTGASLAAGVLGAIVAAMACIWWTLRTLAGVSERSLLAGQLAGDEPGRRVGSRRWAALGAVGGALTGFAVIGATFAGWMDRTGSFFAAGTALLAACLCLLAVRLRRPVRRTLGGHGWWSVARVGLRNATNRPGRSVLSAAVIASATFILISVDAFRQEGPAPTDRRSGIGGYLLAVDLQLPMAYDPNTPKGREALGLTSADGVTVEPFRVRPGDDASCLNLYEPRNLRILGVRDSFIASNRFAFANTLPPSADERADPWRLLKRDLGGDVVPVAADANSMTYVLHRKLGDDIVLDRGDRPVRLRLVAALADSLFQSELLMSDANFVKLFPDRQGYQFLLVDGPPQRAARVARDIDGAAADLGAEAVVAAERLARFHRVENTYLSTFQALGGLGLLVGTLGLAAVLLRNALERRRELALLGAVGYRRADVFAIVIAENAFLLGWGLVVGTVCALVAIAPAVSERGGRLPVRSGGGLLVFAVLAAGLVSSIVATRVALRTPLLQSLRSE